MLTACLFSSFSTLFHFLRYTSFVCDIIYMEIRQTMCIIYFIVTALCIKTFIFKTLSFRASYCMLVDTLIMKSVNAYIQLKQRKSFSRCRISIRPTTAQNTSLNINLGVLSQESIGCF